MTPADLATTSPPHSMHAATPVLPAHEAIRLTWLKPIGIFGLSIYNFVLRILTLGIHHFWGKTEVRRRVWSSVRINGEPLEYTGTGRELFLGFLIVFGAILMPTVLISFGAALLFGPETTAFKIFQVLLYVGFVFLTGIAIFRAQRYRLNRTRWRGIRAGLDGSSLAYGWTYFWTLLLLPLTVGWIAPWRSTKLQRIVTENMRFGSQPFHFSGSSGPLYKSFALFWVLVALLAVATGVVIGGSVTSLVAVSGDGEMPQQLPPGEVMAVLGIIYGALFVASLIYMVLSAWYRASMMRHFARYTHLAQLNFKSTVSARGLLGIAITNYLLLIGGALVATLVLTGIGFILIAGLGMLGFDPIGLGNQIDPRRIAAAATGALTVVFILSLGMLLPVTQARTTGYLVRNLAFEGTIDTASIAVGADQHIKRGEGLAQAFDIDAI